MKHHDFTWYNTISTHLLFLFEMKRNKKKIFGLLLQILFSSLNICFLRLPPTSFMLLVEISCAWIISTTKSVLEILILKKLCLKSTLQSHKTSWKSNFLYKKEKIIYFKLHLTVVFEKFNPVIEFVTSMLNFNFIILIFVSYWENSFFKFRINKSDLTFSIWGSSVVQFLQINGKHCIHREKVFVSNWKFISDTERLAIDLKVYIISFT